ncbi:ABC transporter ATP-binding protein [Pseudomonas putida]|uniref:ABC transporter ATP-binding protein YbbL n=1 Tax=Pseudomonas putida TaxID=303 RepID=A0A1Q9QYG1_PSEPU|nr:ATP-binding cassette domain-containing protein [Pseudomonas putida]OLS60186.1 putative ABC transporter ATP-binding protein YbbL [Pseudomonas putida]
MAALIQARQLSRTAATGAPTLLAATDFTLHSGDRVTIIGASGSGKSVFLRALALLDPPDSGEVIWQGAPVSAQQITRYRASVCYLAQRPAMVDGTVRDNLGLPFTLKAQRQRHFDAQVAGALLAQAGKPASFLDKSAADLSGGEAQIVALIRVLQLKPEVMLFDEPTAALDPQSAAAVERLVLEWSTAQRGFIWVTHDPEQARRMGNRHLSMEQGALQP